MVLWTPVRSNPWMHYNPRGSLGETPSPPKLRKNWFISYKCHIWSSKLLSLSRDREIAICKTGFMTSASLRVSWDWLVSLWEFYVISSHTASVCLGVDPLEVDTKQEFDLWELYWGPAPLKRGLASPPTDELEFTNADLTKPWPALQRWLQWESFSLSLHNRLLGLRDFT